MVFWKSGSVCFQIVKVGEEKKKIPGNLKGLSIGLEEDIVPHKQVMQDTVIEWYDG